MRRLKAIIFFLLLINGQSVATAEDRKTYTLDEMASRIQERTGSQILSAEVQQTRQGEIYRFKVKKDGRVRVMTMRPDGSPIEQK